MSKPLPEFERPPLDEVVTGVQFDPLKDFRAAHLGLYWSRVRERYPDTDHQPPLAPQIEPESVSSQGPAISVQMAPLIPRCWFLESSKNELVQLQSDRFLRNWRQIEGNEPYPRFPYLIKRFREEWQGLLLFLNEERLGAPNVNQCELSYINHIEPGLGWKDFSELDKAFATLRAPAGSAFLPTPELVIWESRYKLPEGRGRLHVQVLPVFRARDFKLILSFNLTARGAPSTNTSEAIFAWFDLAHQWIVNAFDELTQPGMHKIWEKKRW
jgi:uncharacterized protein (TIGR04255 family)